MSLAARPAVERKVQPKPAKGKHPAEEVPALTIGAKVYVVQDRRDREPSIDAAILVSLPVPPWGWAKVNHGIGLCDFDEMEKNIYASEAGARVAFAKILKKYVARLRRALAKANATDSETVAIRDKTGQASKRIKALMKAGAQ